MLLEGASENVSVFPHSCDDISCTQGSLCLRTSPKRAHADKTDRPSISTLVAHSRHLSVTSLFAYQPATLPGDMSLQLSRALASALSRATGHSTSDVFLDLFSRPSASAIAKKLHHPPPEPLLQNLVVQSVWDVCKKPDSLVPFPRAV